MKPFVTLGDLIADLYLGIEGFPVEPGRHQDLSGIVLGPGGAGNALVAAARLGLPAVALGGIGADWVGARVLGHLRAEGVDVSHVVSMPGEETAVAAVLRAEGGEHVFLGYYGGRGPARLPEAYEPVLQSAGVVLVDGWTYRHDWPAMILAGVEAAAAAGVGVMFDPGPQVGDMDRAWLQAMIRAAVVLLVTEEEARSIIGLADTPDPRGLVDSLRAFGARVVVIKRGAQGCVIAADEQSIESPGFVVEARDLTAAGDCFAAAVAWGVLHARPWDVIGAVANAAGAVKVGKIGSALAAPTRAEVGALLHAHRPDIDWP